MQVVREAYAVLHCMVDNNNTLRNKVDLAVVHSKSIIGTKFQAEISFRTRVMALVVTVISITNVLQRSTVRSMVNQ